MKPKTFDRILVALFFAVAIVVIVGSGIALYSTTQQQTLEKQEKIEFCESLNGEIMEPYGYRVECLFVIESESESLNYGIYEVERLDNPNFECDEKYYFVCVDVLSCHNDPYYGELNGQRPNCILKEQHK